MPDKKLRSKAERSLWEALRAACDSALSDNDFITHGAYVKLASDIVCGLEQLHRQDPKSKAPDADATA